MATSYVLVETVALVQRRHGFAGLDLFRAEFEPRLRIICVDGALHRAGVTLWEAARQRDLSLVDCVSFACIRRDAIDAAFAFDEHFAAQGVRVLG